MGVLRKIAKAISVSRAWILLFAFLAAIVGVVESSQPFQACVKEIYYNPETENFEKSISSFSAASGVYRDCFGDFIHDNAETIIAAFTFILASSTIFLWIATRALVRGAEETARQQLRAYVHITKASFSNLVGGAEFFIEYKNCGQTPAYKMRSWNILKYMPYPNDYVFNMEESTGSIALGTLGPNNTQHFPKKGPRVLTALELAAIDKGESAIYLWGAIIYVDAFKNERTTNFRKIIGGRNGISRHGLMSNCADGNDAD